MPARFANFTEACNPDQVRETNIMRSMESSSTESHATSMQKEKSSLLLASVLEYAFAGILFFLPFLVYVNEMFFIDEGDNIVGGMVVAAGKQIYKDFYSQHTPLMYYLMAGLHGLGADNLTSYRVYFYAFLALSFLLIYARYKTDFGRLPLLFLPLIYAISFRSNPSMSYSLISEHLVSIAFVFLLLELLRFIKNRKIDPSNAVVIAGANFVAIGVAFVSIYGVTALNLVFVGLAVKNALSESKDLTAAMALAWRQLRWYFLILFAPFAVFLSWYSLEGNLQDFCYQAYTFNREVYSKYNGGLGRNIFSPMYEALKIYYHFFIKYLVSAIKSPTDLSSFRYLLNFAANMIFVALIYKKSRGAALGIGVFIIATVLRTMEGFHAVQYWAISALMLMLIIDGRYIGKDAKVPQSHPSLHAILFGIVAVAAIIGPIKPASIIESMRRKDAERVPELTKEFYISNFLRRDEGFYDTSLDPLPYIQTNHIPSTKHYGLVPWFAEVWERDFIAQLESSRTRLIFHDPKNSVWGYVLEDYAPRLNKYILSHYTKLEGDYTELGGVSPNVYIRNEDYPAALEFFKSLNNKLYEFTPGVTVGAGERPIGEIFGEKIVSQSFIAEKNNLARVYVYVGTFSRVNSGSLKMTLLFKGKEISSRTFDLSKLQNNGPIRLDFPPLADSKGKKFLLQVSSSDSSSGNAVTVWMSEKDNYPQGTLHFGDTLLEGDLLLFTYYKP